MSGRTELVIRYDRGTPVIDLPEADKMALAVYPEALSLRVKTYKQCLSLVGDLLPDTPDSVERIAASLYRRLYPKGRNHLIEQDEPTWKP